MDQGKKLVVQLKTESGIRLPYLERIEALQRLEGFISRFHHHQRQSKL
jgi:hypothetical protein